VAELGLTIMLIDLYIFYNYRKNGRLHLEGVYAIQGGRQRMGEK